MRKRPQPALKQGIGVLLFIYILLGRDFTMQKLQKVVAVIRESLLVLYLTKKTAQVELIEGYVLKKNILL